MPDRVTKAQRKAAEIDEQKGDPWAAMKGRVKALQRVLAQQDKVYWTRLREWTEQLFKGEIDRRNFDYMCGEVHKDIRDTEDEIVLMRSHMPPWAVYKDGVTTIFPVTERIDPREKIDK